MNLLRIGALGLALFSVSAFAQRPPGPHRGGFPPPPPHVMIDRLSQMTPEQRQKMLDRLPPDRRERVEEHLKQWEGLSPETREALRRQYSDFQQMSPEKRDAIRSLFKRFSEMPEERRRELHRELGQLRNMPADRRAERLSSDQFKSEYNEQEREMLEGLAALPPPPRMGPRGMRPHGGGPPPRPDQVATQ